MRFLDNNISHLWKVWLATSKASIVREMEFRANFILGVIRQSLWLGIFVIFINLIFGQTDSLSGWSQNQVLIILALSRLIEGFMNAMFVNNLMMLPRTVQTGEFDFYLLKPVPVQFYTAFRFFRYQNVGNMALGLILLGYALTRSDAIMVSPLNWLLFIALVFLGITIYYCLLILVASLVFVLERLEALWGFNELFSEPLTVPFDIFPRGPRIALTYLLPLAFVVFVPAQALTDRLAWWQLPLATLLALIFLTLSNIAWKAGLRRYSSASS